MPLFVVSSAIVGFTDVLQHTPLAVTGVPPSEVTVPPPEAELSVTDPGVAVVTTGGVDVVVNSFCPPYTVPFMFVAYALM